MRKYGQAIKASGSKFHAQPPNFFFGAKWADIVRGATGQAVAEPIVKNGKIVRTVAGEFATTRRDLATVLHELGHAQQFKEVSKLTRARFARQGKFGGKTLEALHEADAYRRGIKVAKGMNAKKIVFKAGAARMANSYGYIGLQYGAGAGAAAASVGGYALLKKNDDRPRDSGKV